MTVHSPIPDFAAARAVMVDSQLRPEGVTDAAVLAAMGSVEREFFLPGGTRPLAYVDRAVSIGDGRFMMAPAALGQLLTHVLAEPGQSALVVAAGTGYSAAILSAMGLDVTALESSAELAGKAAKLGIRLVQGELEAGWPGSAPYDRILIDGAVHCIPDAIVAQLADGGRLGAALVAGPATRLIVGRKSGLSFGYLSIGDFGVPPLPGFRRPQSFTF